MKAASSCKRLMLQIFVFNFTEVIQMSQLNKVCTSKHYDLVALQGNKVQGNNAWSVFFAIKCYNFYEITYYIFVKKVIKCPLIDSSTSFINLLFVW